MNAPVATSRRHEHAAIGVTILIGLAAALCIMAVVQWVDQTHLTRQVESERKDKVGLQTQLQEKDQANHRYSDEITRLEALRKDLDEIVKTNKTELSRVKISLSRTETELGRATNQVVIFKEGLDKANAAIVQQNESVKQQNAAIKQIAEQRAELATKYNKLAEDYNKVVTDYNALIEQVKKEHEALQKAAEKPEKK